MESFE